MMRPAVLAVLLLFVGCLCPAPATRPEVEPDKTSRGAFAIARATFRGSIWNDAMKRSSVLFQDGAGSFAVPGGSVWAFGDTFLGSRGSDGKLQYSGAKSCTLAFLKDGAQPFPPALEYRTDAMGIAETPFEFLPGESWERNRIWPGGGIHLDGRFYLYYALIELTDGEPPWNFRAVGHGLARSDSPLGHYKRLQPGGNWRFPIATSRVLLAGEWIYLYEAGEIAGRRGVVLARVRPSRIEEPRGYEFYAGPGPRFTPHREEARLLVEDVYGQVSVAWNRFLGQYVMACSSDFSWPREIVFRTSQAPYGPFSARGASIRTPETQGAVTLVYCSYLHPELSREGDRVFVLTFCPMLKDAGFKEGFANAEMVEIVLDKRREE